MKTKNTLYLVALTVLCTCFLFALNVSGAFAKYGSYNAAEAYLPWSDANTLYQTTNVTTATQGSPHGGYTQTTYKCVVCHSTHRAWSAQTVAGVGDDNKLLMGGTSSVCVECHAAWGTNPSSSLVEVGQVTSGPHIGNGGSTCVSKFACHGSVHGGKNSTYAVVNAYNLQNPASGADIDVALDTAIAAGNTAPEIGKTYSGQAMKAYATGYLCYPCHGNSSFSIAKKGFANAGITVGSTTAPLTGHPSTGASSSKWIPTCEGCHDMIGVATNSTAFPHANRGINVYQGRFNQYTQAPVTSGTVYDTDNTDATRYGLWMTSGEYSGNATATPIVDASGSRGGLGKGMSLRDGSCIKCHAPAVLSSTTTTP